MLPMNPVMFQFTNNKSFTKRGEDTAPCFLVKLRDPAYRVQEFLYGCTVKKKTNTKI